MAAVPAESIVPNEQPAAEESSQDIFEEEGEDGEVFREVHDPLRENVQA